MPRADVPPRDRSQSPKLIVSKRPGDTSVKEKSQVLDEKISHKTVEVIDEATGKPTIQRLQVVQKVIETEVQSNNMKEINFSEIEIPILFLSLCFKNMQMC